MFNYLSSIWDLYSLDDMYNVIMMVIMVLQCNISSSRCSVYGVERNI